MIDLYGVLQEQETVNGELGLGVDYYKGEKGEQGIPGKDGKDGSDQVYVGADEPTDERVKLWIDTDATPPSETVSWDEIENKPNLADVATSGDYNDLSNKPTIPSTTGLASEAYVNEKVAAIVIPEVPTKVSELENDAGYLTEHQSLVEYAKKTDIPAPYTLPTASTSTLGGVKVDGNTITIADGVISSVGSAEPDAYIKDASVSGNTLTLTKKDDTEVVFTPSGGSSGGSGYAFTSRQTFTDEDKIHLKEAYMGKNVHMTIDYLTVIRMMSLGSKWGFTVVNTNGASSNQVQVYTIDIDSNGNITSDKFTLFMSYALMGSETLTGTILTTDNWPNYISIPVINDWIYTTDMQDSNLYNAKEIIVFWSHNNLYASTYINLTYGKHYTDSVGGGTLGYWNWENLLLAGQTNDHNVSSVIVYTGSELAILSNVEQIYGVLYKT